MARVEGGGGWRGWTAEWRAGWTGWRAGWGTDLTFCKDPSLNVIVTDVWTKWHSARAQCSAWAAVVSSDVAVSYELAGTDGTAVVPTRMTWFS